MPNKKNKNQGRNAFYFFMVALRPQLERQGVILENGMQTLAEIAGPRWKDLPEQEKEVYQEMARQSKINKKFAAPRNDRMDCTGQFLSKRVDTVSLNEKRRKEERDEVKKNWHPGKAVCDEKFIMVAFMSLCELLPDNRHLPCEVGAVEFSLNGGILRTMHRFIRPGAIPLGFRYQAMKSSEETHKIPADERGLAGENDTYRSVWMELLSFVNPEKKTVFPPVYCRISETKQTEICLNWLARNAEMTNKLRKVYELEGLICDLHLHSQSSPVGISKPQATDLISSSVFDYELNTRCKWHEDQEVKYCALGTVKRYCYCMSDFLCPVFSIALTPNHVPERPEGTFCTVLNPSELDTKKDNSSTVQQRSAYGSQDYRYRESPSADAAEQGGLYMRRGPTYDAKSFQDSAPQVQQTRQPRQNQNQAQYNECPTARKPENPSFGRGRGRGRGAVPDQPLRRPGIMQQQQQAKGSWASMVSSEQPSTGRVTNIPMWAASDPEQSGMGYGAGAQPSTRPKVYAGTAAAPPASIAPPPPLAWQQQQKTNCHEIPEAARGGTQGDRQVLNQQDNSVSANSSANPWNMRAADVNSLAMQVNAVGITDYRTDRTW